MEFWFWFWFSLTLSLSPSLSPSLSTTLFPTISLPLALPPFWSLTQSLTLSLSRSLSLSPTLSPTISLSISLSVFSCHGQGNLGMASPLSKILDSFALHSLCAMIVSWNMPDSGECWLVTTLPTIRLSSRYWSAYVSLIKVYFGGDGLVVSQQDIRTQLCIPSLRALRPNKRAPLLLICARHRLVGIMSNHC